MSWHKVEQYALIPLPPRMPAFRRRQCLCGCGRWWYQARAKGRPTDYATPECAMRERNRRRRFVYLVEAQRAGGEGA